MPIPRPPQPETPPRDAFEIHRAQVADGIRLAYLREGAGGYPLLLVHGYPETKHPPATTGFARAATGRSSCWSSIRRLAAAWAPYQLEYGRPMSEPPLFLQQVQTPTLILYGPDDQIVPKDFPKRCEIAFPKRVGPLVIPECGHFLQWERADVLNDLATMYFGDLRSR